MEFGGIWVIQALILVFGGLITSFTDIKYGSIRNIHILLFGGLGFLLNFVQLFYSDFSTWWIGGFILSIIFSCILWWRDLVPAGDAKLLIATSAAVPVWWYPNLAPVVFPFSIIFLFATFIAAIPVIFAAFFSKDVILKQGSKDIGSRVWGLLGMIVYYWAFLVAWRLFATFEVSWSARAGLFFAAFIGLVGLIALPEIMRIISRFHSILVCGLFVFAGIYLWIGGSWIFLLSSAICGICVFEVVDLVRRRIISSSIDRIKPEEVRKGHVILGMDDPEGLSSLAAQRIRSLGVEVWVWQEVRFAHAVFGAVILVGVLKLFEIGFFNDISNFFKSLGWF